MRNAIPAQSSPLPQPARHYLSFGFFAYSSTLLYFSVGRLPVILADRADIPYEQIGQFALAIDICFFTLRELFFSIAESLQAKQLVQFDEGEHDKIAKSMKLSITYTLVIMVPFLLLVYVYQTALLRIVGPDYIAAGQFLPWFLLTGMLVTLAWIYRQVLIFNRMEKRLLVISALSLLCFALGLATLGSITLIHLTWSVVGAAAFYLVAVRINAVKYLSFTGDAHLLASLFAGGGLFFFTLDYLKDYGLLMQLASIPLAGGLYLGTLWALKIIGRNEVELLRRIIRALTQR